MQAPDCATRVHVPALDTERLQLRGHRREDLDDSAALWGDAQVTRFIGGRPLSAEEVWARYLRHVGHWALFGYGYWVIRERSSGRFAGEIGFANLQRDLVPPLGDAPEIGWALSPWAHGQGFATEAVRAALAWGERQFGEQRTVCIIDPANERSIRVAERCGYRHTLVANYKGAPIWTFERSGTRPS